MTILKSLVKNILLALRDILDPLFRFREVAVLCYHEYDPHLESHITALKTRGYEFVPLADIVAWVKGATSFQRKKMVAITFDDGYPDFESQVLPLLVRYSVPVTLFATGTFDTTRLRGREGVEIGNHTKTHPNLTKLEPAQIDTEVARAGERYFAYPGGNHSPQATAAVRRAGYEAAFTIRPVLVRQGRDPYLLPRAVITPDMGLCDVLFYASKAADWYCSLKIYG